MALMIKQDGKVKDLIIPACGVQILDMEDNFKSSNLEEVLQEIGEGDSVYISDEEPDKDGLWVDTTNTVADENGADENIIAKQIKKYINNKMGDLSGLSTDTKDNLVNAINENVTQLSEKANKDELLNKRDISVKIVMEDLSTDIKTAITGGSVPVVADNSISTSSIINNNVIAEKTDFVKRINYFNHLEVVNGYINPNGNGVIINSNDSNYKTSPFIEVSAHDTVRIKYPNKATYPVGYALFDNTKQFISYTSFNNWTSKSTITIPLSAKYIRFSINIINSSNWYDIVSLTINRNDYEDFIPYKNIRIPNIVIDQKSISSDKLDFISKVNLFNFEKATNNQKLNNDGTVAGSDSYTYISDLIEILQNANRVNIKYPNAATFDLKVCFYDNNNAFISVFPFKNWSNVANIDIPPNAKYIRFSFNISNDSNWRNTIMLLFDRDIPSTFIPYGSIDIPSLSHIDKNTETRLAELENKTNTTTFFMPTELYLIKNRCGKRKLKLENVLNALNIDDFYIEKEGANIYSKDKKYIIIDDNVGGSNGQNVKVADVRTLKNIYSKNLYTLRVIENGVNPTSIKNILMIGDSFMDNGYLPCETKNILVNQFGLSNLNFIGTKTFTDTNSNTTCKHQGVGGITIMDCIKIDNTQGRGVNWSNPFLNNGVVSYANYMDKNGFEGSLDYVVIELGVNDILALGDNVKTTVERLKTMINSIHTDYPNCKIFIVGQKYASEETIYIDSYKWNKTMMDLNSSYQAVCESDVYKTYCYYVDIGVMFDKLYGSTFTMKAPYKGSDVTIVSVTDWLHPNKAGYYMIAENIASAVAYRL